MPLLNYTTTVPTFRTIAEVQQALVKAKAQAILSEYDAGGNVTAISFKVVTQCGIMAFKLPCDVQKVCAVLNRAVREGKVPRRLLNDSDYARRVAWRILKDWIEAQMALIETEMATLDQVFLPYAHTETGETLYQRMIESKFKGLQIEGPKETRAE